MERFRKYWPLLFLLLLTAIPLWRCLLLGETIGPWDQVRQMSPWNQPTTAPWDVLQADSVLQFYGWRDLVFKAYASGHMPFWNHYELAGTPLLANSQSGALYPLHVLMGVAHVPTPIAISLLAWFHLTMAAWGIYYFARKLGASLEGSLIGAAAFAGSGFLIAWTPLASVVTTVAWIPWCLAACCSLDTKKSRVLLAIAFAMMILGGHLQFVAYGTLAILLFCGIRYKQTPIPKAAICLVIGACLASPQLIPVLIYGRHSHRQNSPSMEGFSAYNAGAIAPFELLSLANPNLLGKPTDSLEVGGSTISGFWPAIAKRGDNYAESAIGIGPIALLLLIFGLRKKELPATKGAYAIFLLGLLLAAGTAVGGILYFLVPGWSATGSPGRAAVLLVLASAVLAALGFPSADSDLIKEKSVRWKWGLFAAFVIIFPAALLQLPQTSWIPGFEWATFAALIPKGRLMGETLLLAGIAAALVIASTKRPRFRSLIAAILAALCFIPSFGLIRSDKDRLPEVTTAATRIAVINSGWELLGASKAVLPPDTAMQNGIHELGGYDSIIDKRTRDALAELDGEDPAPPANGNMMFIKPKARMRQLADYGVDEIWSGKPIDAPGVSLEQDSTADLYKYKIAGGGRLQALGGAATIKSETSSDLTIEVSGPTTLVVKDFLRDGWSTEDGSWVAEPDDTSWPTVKVTGTNQIVHFTYQPPGFKLGLILFLIGIVGIIATLKLSEPAPVHVE